MLKRFLLIFFILSTVFISSYPMERDKASGHLSWDNGSHIPEELLTEITPPPVIQSGDQFSAKFNDIFESLEKIDKKRLATKPFGHTANKKLAHTIEQMLLENLKPLELPFNSEEELQENISFESKQL